MSRQVNPKEMESVLSLSGPERYGFFVQKVVEQQVAWGLRSEEGWVLVGFDGQGSDAFCIWPDVAYTEACAAEGWNDCAPEPIPLQELMEELIPSLLADELRLAVFPTPAGQAIVVDPRDLQAHLEAEIEHALGHQGGQS